MITPAITGALTGINSGPVQGPPKTQAATTIVVSELSKLTAPEGRPVPVAYSIPEKGIKILPLAIAGLVVWYLFIR